MTTKLSYDARFDAAGGALVALVATTHPRMPLARPRITQIDFDDWLQCTPPHAIAAVGRVLDALGEAALGLDGKPFVTLAEGGVRLAPDFIAALPEAEARSLGFPPALRLSLELEARDHLASPNFGIGLHWRRPNGMAAGNVRVAGARVVHEGRDWRLVEPVATIWRLAQSVNAAIDLAERQARLCELRAALPDEHQELVRADGYIERLRLSHAAAFSLSLDTRGDGFDFDPVLFARQAVAEADEAGQMLDEEADGLLPPSLQADFARKFRTGNGERRNYLLADGSILFIDPSLGQALKLVRRAQAGTPEERKTFARNPRRAIRAALGCEQEAEEGPDGATAIEALFIETQQFSERVSGVDIWRKPVLPWIKPKPNSWLPERFGLRIGEGNTAQDVMVNPAEIEAVAEHLDRAIAEGQSTVEIGGVAVPATEQTRAALASLRALGESADGSRDDHLPPASLAGRYFLQIRDNLAEVEYAPLSTGSTAPAALAEPSDTLKSTLKPHQLDGFRWLAAAWQARLPGVLLADDMGLGKTFQALAFLAWLRRVEGVRQPTLIVAPTGLLANWETEIRAHLAPDALGRAVRAYGAGLRAGGRADKDIAVGAAQLDPSLWDGAGIVLTTFETMRDYHMSFARTPFAVIIYDEAQKLKNPASQMTRAAKTLNARFQIAMTGTPVENRLQDLWSILDVVHPGLLGSSRAFEQRYPPTDTAKLRELNDRLTQPMDARPPVFLRRMKSDHLPGLPEKHVHTLRRDMPPAQARAYAAAVARAIGLRGSSRGYMLEVLHQLRGISLHPRDPQVAGGEVDAYVAESARLGALFQLLESIHAKGEKALIFCESLAMQALLAVHIRRRFSLAHEVPRIHGGVMGDARQRAVDAFQTRPIGFDVMILSPKAGGVGLTLTAANHVIHLSRWWNPAVEDQATDRVYRIGQTRDVHVYLPQAVHPDPGLREASFDLKLDALMTRKRDLSRDLLVPPEDAGDADSLFDAVVAGNATAEVRPAEETTRQTQVHSAAEASPTISPERSGPAGEPATPARRQGRLTLPGFATRVLARTAPVIPAPEVSATVPTAPISQLFRRMSFASNTPRDWSIIDDPVRGEQLVSVTIRDPYACSSPWHRDHVIAFVKRLEGVTRGIEDVILLAFDGDSVNRLQPETAAEQQEDMDRRWRQRFSGGPPLRLRLISRRQQRSFHDRQVKAVTRSGRTILWDLTNGVDGLMAPNKECTVIMTIETRPA